MPQPPKYLGLVWGALGILGFVLPFIVLGFAPILGVIWAGWDSRSRAKNKIAKLIR